MKRIGLTGGIGSGKTVVSNLFQLMGVPVFNADDCAKKLYDTDPFVRDSLVNLFGPAIYQGTKLNRALLAELIFNQSDLLKQVNALVHPKVGDQWANWVLNQKNTPLVVQESALLFEAGMAGQFDAIITISAPESQRVERVCHRSHLSEAQVLKRMNNQLAEMEKIKKSDYIIVNDNYEPLIPQVLTVLHQLSL
jgi:dephospho-CoA kinase